MSGAGGWDILQVVGIIVAALFMSLCAGIAIGRRIKAVNDTRDEHAQGHGIGGANILNHSQLATDRERNDHV